MNLKRVFLLTLREIFERVGTKVNLIIDQGNTRIKFALFDADKLLHTFTSEVIDIALCERLLSDYKSIENCIFSSVANPSIALIDFLSQRISFFLFMDEKVKLPIENAYKSPKTLGRDRIAAAVGAKMQFPNHFVLVVDAGTAITYEFVTENGCYLGGNISPGISLRFRALNEFTQKLPLVSKSGDLPEIGYDTDTAIRAGVIEGLIHEMSAYIEQYKLRYPNFELILTGGDAIFLESKLKSNTFVDENLVLKGLNTILNYNVEK